MSLALVLLSHPSPPSTPGPTWLSTPLPALQTRGRKADLLSTLQLSNALPKTLLGPLLKATMQTHGAPSLQPPFILKIERYN